MRIKKIIKTGNIKCLRCAVEFSEEIILKKCMDARKEN